MGQESHEHSSYLVSSVFEETEFEEEVPVPLCRDVVSDFCHADDLGYCIARDRPVFQIPMGKC